MFIKNPLGVIAHTSEAKAARLVAEGAWSYADEKPAERSEPEPQGATPEKVVEAVSVPVSPSKSTERPAPPVVRAWAAENGITVAPKGKIKQDVYDQYAEAHQN
jgi:Lsr2 protein